MSSVIVAGDTSGSVTLQAPAIAGSTVLTLPTTTGTLVVNSGAQTIEFADGSASAPSITNSGDTNTGIFFPAADTIAFAEGGTESMRIDSSGHVGIGVTPPAWGSQYSALQMGTFGTSLSGYNAGGGATALSHNVYNTSPTTPVYYNSYSAAQYQMNGSGSHFWQTAPSGTAGNAITFTTTMTLDASGNLGLGVTPSAWGSGYKVFELAYAGSNLHSGDGSDMNVNANAYYNAAWKYATATSTAASRYSQYQGAHNWYTAPAGTAGNNITFTTAMTLDASSNLTVNGYVMTDGFSSPTTRYYSLRSGYAPNAAGGVGMMAVDLGTGNSDGLRLSGNQGILFSTGATERMRIDSSGTLLLLQSTATNSAPGIRLVNNVSYPTVAIVTTGTTSRYGMEFYNTVNGLVGTININSTSTSYVTSSDYRLKENIAPMTGALDTVAKLKPVTYKWKADGADGQGFIAHELGEVVPDCVSGEKDATKEEEYEIIPAIPAVLDEEGNEITPAVEAVMGTRTVPVYQGIDTSFLVATLTAAIQELKAIVDTQAEQIKALQGVK